MDFILKVFFFFFLLNWKCSPVFSLVICPANSCGKWCWFMNLPSGNKHPPWRGGGRKGFALKEGHVLGLGDRCCRRAHRWRGASWEAQQSDSAGPLRPCEQWDPAGRGLSGQGRRLRVRPLTNEWRNVGMKSAAGHCPSLEQLFPYQADSVFFLCTSSVSKLKFQLIIS